MVERIEFSWLGNVAENQGCIDRHIDFYLPGDRGLQAEQRLEQSGLAGAVGSENGGEAGPGKRQRLENCVLDILECLQPYPMLASQQRERRDLEIAERNRRWHENIFAGVLQNGCRN